VRYFIEFKRPLPHIKEVSKDVYISYEGKAHLSPKSGKFDDIATSGFTAIWGGGHVNYSGERPPVSLKYLWCAVWEGYFLYAVETLQEKLILKKYEKIYGFTFESTRKAYEEIYSRKNKRKKRFYE
jgi:hypothetical protein